MEDIHGDIMKGLIISLYTLIFLFLSCIKDQSPLKVGEFSAVAITQDYGHISDPQQRWEAYKIKYYVITQIVGCYCPFGYIRFRTVIRDEKVYRILDDKTDEIITNPTSIRSINQLFEFVDSINADSVAKFEVEYDDKLGYPKFVYVDRDSMVVDEEISYTTEFLNKIVFN